MHVLESNMNLHWTDFFRGEEFNHGSLFFTSIWNIHHFELLGHHTWYIALPFCMVNLNVSRDHPDKLTTLYSARLEIFKRRHYICIIWGIVWGRYSMQKSAGDQFFPLRKGKGEKCHISQADVHSGLDITCMHHVKYGLKEGPSPPQTGSLVS